MNEIMNRGEKHVNKELAIVIMKHLFGNNAFSAPS